jgi:hypothetical protein
MTYITLTEAETYFSSRLHSEKWHEASELDKERALATATRRINSMRFIGKKLDPTQENAWPRNVYDGIPPLIKYATCEEALSLLEADSEAQRGVVSVRIGDAGETYDALTVRQNLSLSQPARTLLEPLLLKVVPFR